MVRIFIRWPKAPKKGEDLDPASVQIVFQTNNVQEAVVHFHDNERYAGYFHDGKGFKAWHAVDREIFPAQKTGSLNIDVFGTHGRIKPGPESFGPRPRQALTRM